MPRFNVGFPLAMFSGAWEFVLVHTHTDKDAFAHGQRWLNDRARRSNLGLRDLLGTGTANACGAARSGNIIGPDTVLEFIHVAEQRAGKPRPWRETSDTAACVLALASEDRTEYRASDPTILISCDCWFGPATALPRAAGYDVGFQWARLRPVSTSDDPEQNLQALRDKWVAAASGVNVGVPVMALVLHEEDAALLGRSLERRPIPLTGHVLRKLPQLPTEWPALISAESLQLPLLARSLGLDPDQFKSNIPVEGPQAEFAGFCFHIFAEHGLRLSVKEWEEAIPRMMEEVDKRLTLRLLDELSPTQEQELEVLAGGIDEESSMTPEQQRSMQDFWTTVGAMNPEIVAATVQEFGDQMVHPARVHALRGSAHDLCKRHDVPPHAHRLLLPAERRRRLLRREHLPDLRVSAGHVCDEEHGECD